MPSPAVARTVPTATRIAQHITGSYFHDCYEIEVADPSKTAIGHMLAAARLVPAWVEALMALRNRLIRLVGIKNLGALGNIDPSKPEAAYQPGDRVGIFTLRSSSPAEVVVGDKDKHLDVLVSLVVLPRGPGEGQRIALTTVVHTHNLLGRAYMLPVTPMHKLIVPAVLARLAGVR